MEQGVEERSTIYLRFKFYTFFDLNPKVAVVFQNIQKLCFAALKGFCSLIANE